MIENNARKIQLCLSRIDQYYLSFETPELTGKSLNDYFDISIGRTPPTKESKWFAQSEEGNIKWLSIKDMQSDKPYLYETSQWLTKEAVGKFNIPEVESGDVLISFKLTVGRVAIAGEKMVTNEAIACFKASEETRYYLYCFLRHSNFLSDGGNTSSIGKAVNLSIIKRFPFELPKRSDLMTFNDDVEPLFRLMDNLYRQNILLSRQKKVLLKRYFDS